jgi:integrase
MISQFTPACWAVMPDDRAGHPPPGQAELDAARLLLARTGVSPSDLVSTSPSRPPAPTFAEYIRSCPPPHVVARRNAHGGRSATEHLIAALRCLYNHAVTDGLLAEADNPARKVAKPRRLPSTRRAVPDTRLAEINRIAATTGNDAVLDSLLLRLHTETACRRGGALALRPADLDPDQCLIRSPQCGGHGVVASVRPGNKGVRGAPPRVGRIGKPV